MAKEKVTYAYGKDLKMLARWLRFFVIFGSVVFFIVYLSLGLRMDGLIWLGCGVVSTLIVSSLLSGFGELIEAAQAIRQDAEKTRILMEMQVLSPAQPVPCAWPPERPSVEHNLPQMPEHAAPKADCICPVCGALQASNQGRCTECGCLLNRDAQMCTGKKWDKNTTNEWKPTK